jgi:hypothetical protein
MFGIFGMYISSRFESFDIATLSTCALAVS